jgi:hypothetical protein
LHDTGPLWLALHEELKLQGLGFTADVVSAECLQLGEKLKRGLGCREVMMALRDMKRIRGGHHDHFRLMREMRGTNGLVGWDKSCSVLYSDSPRCIYMPVLGTGADH